MGCVRAPPCVTTKIGQFHRACSSVCQHLVADVFRPVVEWNTIASAGVQGRGAADNNGVADVLECRGMPAVQRGRQRKEDMSTVCVARLAPSVEKTVMQIFGLCSSRTESKQALGCER